MEYSPEGYFFRDYEERIYFPSIVDLLQSDAFKEFELLEIKKENEEVDEPHYVALPEGKYKESNYILYF